MKKEKLSLLQKIHLRSYGWDISFGRSIDDLGVVYLRSSPVLRSSSQMFIEKNKELRETLYRSQVIARPYNGGYAFAASAKLPDSSESHIWSREGRDLNELIDFVEGVVNPVLFGLNIPEEVRKGVRYNVINLAKFFKNIGH